MKSLKDKANQQDKDVKEGSVLQTAGPAGEITAGMLLFPTFAVYLYHGMCHVCQNS